MTARLSPLQRQVLEQLAHIRVAPEDAWMTRERLCWLVLGRDTGSAWKRIGDLLKHLSRRGLISYDREFRAWRITDKGREALG